jgi:hypothetical protein
MIADPMIADPMIADPMIAACHHSPDAASVCPSQCEPSVSRGDSVLANEPGRARARIPIMKSQIPAAKIT